MARLDDVARVHAGGSVTDTLYSNAHGKGDPFDRTLFSHPAIFMVEYSLAQTLMAEGVRPDMVLGLSLGSFAAAAIAGFLSAEDALAGVVRQAIALEEHSEPGGMIAVLASPALFKEDFLCTRSELAAVNFDTHFVVSARASDLAGIEACLRSRNVAYQRLPVSFPFHSRWMDEARSPFLNFMRAVRPNRGQMPLLCCDTAKIVYDLPNEYFWNVVRHRMRFRETTTGLARGPHRYIDVGPAGTLATFLKYSMPDTPPKMVHSVLTPYGMDQTYLAKLLASTRQ
jgi:acyl transferase domain-containing protein